MGLKNHRTAFEALKPHVKGRSFLIETHTWFHLHADRESVDNGFTVHICGINTYDHGRRFEGRTLDEAVAKALYYLKREAALEDAAHATEELPDPTPACAREVVTSPQVVS